LLKSSINISFLTNPFYVYCFAFLLAVLTYLTGWSNIYPSLSLNLVLFLIFSCVPFAVTGYFFENKKFSYSHAPALIISLPDTMFYVILVLGILNISIMGYLPVLDRSRNYREFGAPVIDVLFNTLSIFFSVVYLQSFLEHKKKRFLGYLIVFLIIQIALFRRSTIIWIVVSSLFFLIFYKKKISLSLLISGIVLIPLISFAFGFLGNTRGNISRSRILNTFGVSQRYKNSGLGHNNYMTYLYISSPLANLLENINPQDKFMNKGDLKSFLFYCIVPPSLTLRIEKNMNLSPPVRRTIIPELIVGTCYMVSYCTMGFPGMICMCIFILIYSVFCLTLVSRWNTFFIATLSILSTAISLLIFDNILIRLDVIFMLFAYPLLFHFINSYLNKRKVLL
jgi:hypothetical protein